MKTILLTAALCLSLGMTAQAQEEKRKSLYVAHPGTMVELITEDEANAITHLTLKGKLNAIDFRHLRDEFKNLSELDISTASISLYAGKKGTHHDRFYVYPVNCIPAYAFCRQINDSTWQGKESLRRVILSDKTKNIEDAAFKGCSNLEVCQIRRKSAPNLLPEALADTLTAIFIPLGCTDAYRNENRWGEFAFIEGEPVAVNVKIADMSSLGSELARRGIQPKDINYLRIEGKTDNADFTLIRDYMPHLVRIDLSESNATTIPPYTFTQKKHLLRVNLPHGLKTIGQRAFSGCIRLSGTLQLPPTVNALEYGAFMGCPRLRYVSAKEGQITTLGENLFGEEDGKIVYTKE